MSELWQLPGYVALARREAARLGAAHDYAAAAILAQWQCEQPEPAPWPAPHNNPGNLTRFIGALDGEPHSVATARPGAGLLYVYATMTAGADAYANYLLRSTRYARALDALRAANPTAFLTDVCNAGYGTRLACVLSILPIIRLAPPAAPVHRWQCAADVVNVRALPNVSARIVGSITRGQIVTGPEVSGGPYRAGGSTYVGWIELSPGRYTAHAFYRQLS